MMAITSPENHRNEAIPHPEPITPTTCPTWKLYDNPFYNFQQGCQSNQHLDHLHLPLSPRKLPASFWDLTFFRSTMESDLEFARAQIIDLKAELEYEHKARRKLQSLYKRVANELAEERRGIKALERVCETFGKEISCNKAEIARMKNEMEEERKMVRMAEALREERVRMKLNEAKIVFEEKLVKFQDPKQIEIENGVPDFKIKQKDEGGLRSEDNGVGSRSREIPICLSHKSSPIDYNDSSSVPVSSVAGQRWAWPEPENPHIKRGIKGFVEFPRVVRAVGSKTRHWSTKLECQKAQIRILLKEASPIRSQ